MWQPDYAKLAPLLLSLLIELRADLREMGEYDIADEIRSRLEKVNIVLEDGRGGTTWRTSLRPKPKWFD